MNLNHLLVPMIQADRENQIARRQVARDAAADRSSRPNRPASTDRPLQLLPLR
jgi:hypothetical protein